MHSQQKEGILIFLTLIVLLLLTFGFWVLIALGLYSLFPEFFNGVWEILWSTPF